jgi:hypothetical protein
VKAAAEDESKEPSVSPLHRALREWIESRLPADEGLLAVKSAYLESSLQAGCPGDASASDKHPWLSPAELKALR